MNNSDLEYIVNMIFERKAEAHESGLVVNEYKQNGIYEIDIEYYMASLENYLSLLDYFEKILIAIDEDYSDKDEQINRLKWKLTHINNMSKVGKK